MPETPQSFNQDSFKAWKSWIEDKAAWVLSYALDEKTAKEYVSYISDYVVNYLYPNDSSNRKEATKNLVKNLTQASSPAFKDTNFQKLVFSLQTPSSAPLLITNYPANPEKEAVISHPKTLQQASELAGEILNNSIDQAISNLHKRRSSSIPVASEEQVFKTLRELKQQKANTTFEKTEDDLRAERIEEYKAFQTKSFTDWQSLSDEVRQDLLQIEKEKREFLKEQINASNEPGAKIQKPEFSFLSLHSPQENIAMIENPLRAKRNKDPILAPKPTQASISEGKPKPKEQVLNKETQPKPQKIEQKVQIDEKPNTRKFTPTPISAPATSSYSKNPFQFLPPKEQKETTKPVSKWEQERLEKLARLAQSAAEATKGSVIYQPDTEKAQPPISVKNAAKNWGKNDQRTQ